METKKGYLYCLYNEMFNYYGDNVYKLGETANIEKRLPSYTTPYLVPPVIKHTSDLLDDSQLAEKILFFELRECRVADNREFFRCELSKIKNVIDYISDLFSRKTVDDICKEYDHILKTNKIICEDENVTEKIINKIINAPNDQKIKLYIESFGFDGHIVETDDTLKRIEREIRERASDVFTNEKELRCLFLYSNLKNRIFEKVLKNENNNDNLKLNSDNYKIKILDDLHKLLNVEWFDRNLLGKIKNMNPAELEKNIEIPEYIQDALKKKNLFRFEGKMPTRYIKLVSLLLNKYNIFSDKVRISNDRNLSYMYGKIQRRESIPTISEYVDILDNILNYSKQMAKKKEELRAKKEGEFKEYAF